jgi:retron-type reverse transcriptase
MDHKGAIPAGAEKKLQLLHERMKAKKYRHQPIRHVYIPKENSVQLVGGEAREPLIPPGQWLHWQSHS